jgi:hypothetical protein
MTIRAGSRFLAFVLASAVWIYAGMSAASGPLTLQAIAPATFDAAAACAWADSD